MYLNESSHKCAQTFRHYNLAKILTTSLKKIQRRVITVSIRLRATMQCTNN